MVATTYPPAWYLDPTSRHEVRYWDGARWTENVSDRGVPIVFGTDSGIPTRFMGYFEHLEMEMMAEAGLTPMQIIVSASRNPAEYLGLKDVGTLSSGHWADFVVLDADPLQDIRNVRKISGVFIGGKELKMKK